MQVVETTFRHNLIVVLHKAFMFLCVYVHHYVTSIYIPKYSQNLIRIYVLASRRSCKNKNKKTQLLLTLRRVLFSKRKIQIVSLPRNPSPCIFLCALSCAKVSLRIILSWLVIRFDRTYIFNHRLQACWQSFCIVYLIAKKKFKSLLGTRQAYKHKFTCCHSYARLSICGKLGIFRKKRV